MPMLDSGEINNHWQKAALGRFPTERAANRPNRLNRDMSFCSDISNAPSTVRLRLSTVSLKAFERLKPLTRGSIR